MIFLKQGVLVYDLVEWLGIITITITRISIIQESGILTFHFGIPASFSMLLTTIGCRAGILYSFLDAGQCHLTSVFMMHACGGTGGVSHVWHAGRHESVWRNGISKSPQHDKVSSFFCDNVQFSFSRPSWAPQNLPASLPSPFCNLLVLWSHLGETGTSFSMGPLTSTRILNLSLSVSFGTLPWMKSQPSFSRWWRRSFKRLLLLLMYVFISFYSWKAFWTFTDCSSHCQEYSSSRDHRGGRSPWIRFLRRCLRGTWAASFYEKYWITFIKLIFIDDEDFNVKVKPYMNVAGTIGSFNSDDRTFTMAPSPYAGLTHESPTISIHAHFLESEKRWGSQGPKVKAGSMIAFGGCLKRIVCKCDTDRSLSFVQIEVDNMTYLTTREDAFASSTSMIFWFYFHQR